MRGLCRSLFVALTVACTSAGGGPGATPDAPAAMPDAGLQMQCGHPGDTGNPLGVGKYCDGLTDCIGLSANLCATLGDPNAHFCTKPCTAGSTTTCGTGATCACQGSQCGCVPDACLH